MTPEEVVKLTAILKNLEAEAKKQGLVIHDQSISRTESGAFILFASMFIPKKPH